MHRGKMRRFLATILFRDIFHSEITMRLDGVKAGIVTHPASGVWMGF